MYSLRGEIDRLLFGANPGVPWRGQFTDPGKPLLFTMARRDRIKNLTGLVDWYGNSPRWRKAANLLLIGGHVEASAAQDEEERSQIERMHALIDRHALDGQVR